MKILSIGNFSNASWDGSIPDEAHIADALVDLGHEVWTAQRGGNVSRFHIANADFILIAQWDGYSEELLKSIRGCKKGPLVYWAFDYQEDGQKWHEDLVAAADLYLSKALSDSKYPNWRWLPQDFAPDFLDKVEAEKDIDVLFTGSWVPWESGQERVKYLKAIDEQFSLQINSFTPDQWKAEGFKNVQGPVMDHDLPALIARTKINFSMDHVISPGYWSDRNAQIMCCGGFVLFKYVPMSEAAFKHHISYFHTVEECLQKIDYYLNASEARERMAEIGYEYAQEHLKVSNRVEDLLRIVKSL